jgi:hypothetical protein
MRARKEGRGKDKRRNVVQGNAKRAGGKRRKSDADYG